VRCSWPESLKVRIRREVAQRFLRAFSL